MLGGWGRAVARLPDLADFCGIYNNCVHLLFSQSIIVYQLWWVSGSGGVRWYSALSLGIEGGVTAMYIAVLTHSQQGVNDW